MFNSNLQVAGKLYFSGVAGKSEADMLIAAGVTRVLADIHDIENTSAFPARALDSGAYRAWKRGVEVDIDHYKSIAQKGDYDFFVAPDVIGDPDKTYENWERYRCEGMLPVWHWGSDPEILKAYLRQSKVVSIGALVPLMRDKDEKMLRGLIKLCESHPGRFHVLGSNWLKSINKVRHLVSMDTSKFLDGGRYGHLIFVHTRNKILQQCPAKILGRGELSRFERCMESAKAMNDYCNR
jgi:hypothetical protein